MTKQYKVTRQHEGDKWYNAGDIRTANPGEVKHLVKSGVLELLPDQDEGQAVKSKYSVGPITAAALEQFGIAVDLSDTQAVLDAIEQAFETSKRAYDVHIAENGDLLSADDAADPALNADAVDGADTLVGADTSAGGESDAGEKSDAPLLDKVEAPVENKAAQKGKGK